jgi:pSer/pThr/pTyr-binding forkhead associated (FHA) protein
MVEIHRPDEASHVTPYLTEITALHEDKVIPLLSGTTLFGRKPTNDVLLTSPMIGSHIAKIVRSSDGSWIEDVGARIYVLVDGDRVEERRLLQDGAAIQLGPYVFRYSDLMTKRE